MSTIRPMRHAALVVLTCLGLACVSATGVSDADFNERMKRVEIGMTKQELYRVFPQAAPRGAKQYPTGVVEVLQVMVERYHYHATGNPNRNDVTGMEGQPQWFYFFQDQLIQYGRPNDWPANPDKIIEIRKK